MGEKASDTQREVKCNDEEDEAPKSRKKCSVRPADGVGTHRHDVLLNLWLSSVESCVNQP